METTDKNNKLLSEFRKAYKDKTFSYKDGITFGLTKYKFYSLVKAGEIEFIESGKYCLKEHVSLSLDAQFKDFSTLINTNSAICLITALSYYGLSDEIVTNPWFLVEHTKTDGAQKKNIQLFRKRDPRWEYGIEKKDGFNITSISRTIVECMAYKNTITGFEGIYALRKAIRGSLVKMTEVWEMAENLGYTNRIGKTLEAYLDEGF